MPLRIRINNRNRTKKIDRKSIKRAALHVLRFFGRRNALIDITFVTNRRIRGLNRRYMKRDVATDVLSFMLGGGSFQRKRYGLVGDVYISSDMARRNAKLFKTRVREELMLYTIHGILHLLGCRDVTAHEKRKMEELEERLFEDIVGGARRATK